ncbi:metal ABC transporter solute-binding protein, Zn/Mn family [Trichlorobacter ammonificans]|uniref:Periplasmic solute binding protein n=1 Tax=Trichlorobacter ammonificans TaxID=2916410 RepID=A0ABM9D984_9BACT|nr:zinc ABC transporter substrate-binding protein [Trichlorobacter ammonificans]CAH2031802.1 Periplasmic solute binding protein [Trichlorobacter ammonificans]
MGILFRLLLLVVALPLLSGCPADGKRADSRKRPVVVTTIFPLYDFARTLAGERMEVTLLLPPGVEPHHFEPRPEEMARIRQAALFVYTGPFMEPWAGRLLAGTDRGATRVLAAAEGVSLLELDDEAAHADHDKHPAGEQHGVDPHVWLDFANSRLMVERIAAALAQADPAGAPQYRQRAAQLATRLEDLDRRYRDGLASCASRVVIHGGHNAFGYLGRRYNLTYRAAAGVSAEVEPTPRRLAELVRLVRSTGSRAVFTEELLSPRIAETIGRETGVTVLKLHGAHNLGKGELSRGITFFDLMDENLKNLRTGLACRQ